MVENITIATSDAVLSFWREAGYDKWFGKDAAFDAAVREKFLPTYDAAAAGKLSSWEAAADGALALCIVLDQFPRNLFRGDARTYAADPLARQVANRALKRGYDQDVPDELRGFFFLPFMHSEDLVDQERCVQLYREAEHADLKYAEEHRDIVRIRVHVIVVPGLARAPIAAPVVRDDAIAVHPEEQHLRIPRVGSEWPAVREDDRFSRAPVLVEDVGTVFGREIGIHVGRSCR